MVCGTFVSDTPFGTWIVIAFGKSSHRGVSVWGGAAAALQTQQEAQTQAKNQRHHQVALTIRYLQEGNSQKQVSIIHSY